MFSAIVGGTSPLPFPIRLTGPFWSVPLEPIFLNNREFTGNIVFFWTILPVLTNYLAEYQIFRDFLRKTSGAFPSMRLDQRPQEPHPHDQRFATNSVSHH